MPRMMLAEAKEVCKSLERIGFNGVMKYSEMEKIIKAKRFIMLQSKMLEAALRDLEEGCNCDTCARGGEKCDTSRCKYIWRGFHPDNIGDKDDC